MGNVPAKESRSRASSLTSPQSSQNYSRSNRRHTTLSLSNSLSIHGAGTNGSLKSKLAEDKVRAKELHCLDLIIRHDENVDGGFLAPHGTYKLNLDFRTDIVRNLIIARQLAPFFTPLQDFDSSWTDEEVTTIASQLPLHAIDLAYLDEEEPDDADNHKIHLSANYYRRQEHKKRLQELHERMKELQRQQEVEYMTAKDPMTPKDRNIPNKQLLLKLYRNLAECPICFLFFPPYLNVSRCCGQPICTECFVQIRRLDPHPPHDDQSNENSSEIPHTLISEPAKCPFCALPDFGVSYEHPKDISVGIRGAVSPSDYTDNLAKHAIAEEPDSAALPGTPNSNRSTLGLQPASPRKKANMLAAEGPRIITTDYIRPDWEQKLANAKSKLARRAATASAIHASNLIVNDDSGSGSRASEQNDAYLQSLEDRMLEEAMRLSLADEQQRKVKNNGK